MNKTFLQCVAQDLIEKYGNRLSRIAIVFPNKRAALFLNEELAKAAGKPLWSPAYITISDLFRRHSRLTVGDPIKLISDLYKCFSAITGSNEPIDRFYGWGQLLLADFDDIDKNMAEASRVFANLRDVHEYDDLSYLTEEQKALLKRFFHHFSEEQHSLLKEKFIRLWSNLYEVYRQFNDLIKSQGIAYEGALYREVVEDVGVKYNYDCYIFVGFNLLQKVEQTLFSKLKSDGKARFYWDFDKYYMPKEPSPVHEAGYYIGQYLKYFPNELNSHDDELYDNLSHPKEMTYISAPTENIQARYIADWLRENGRIEAGRKTAIVLCNEDLLPTVIHCLPPEATQVNITTGYPLSQSPVAALVSQLLVLRSYNKSNRRCRYRLSSISPLLRHPYARYISENSGRLLARLRSERRFFPQEKELTIDEGLTLLFHTESSDAPENLQTCRWLLTLIRRIAINLSAQRMEATDPLMQESLFRMYTLLNRLCALIEEEDLAVDSNTLERLIQQLVSSTSIPFHGEPAVGIQVMGMLETRNIDFDNILILSCNEGNMPKGLNDASFIPHAIRQAYGLTTTDHKGAIFSYYFHRLIQRAKHVTLVYNNATEEGKTGEMSRFMLQLLVESRQKIARQTLQAGRKPILSKPTPIEKEEDVMQRLTQRLDYISPTAINRYLRCPLQFYYNQVAGIKEPENMEEEEIDNRSFGNIFHRASELIYKEHVHRKTVTETDIDRLLKSPHLLAAIVKQAFDEELFNIKETNRQPMNYNGLQLINQKVIVHYLKQLLQIDRRLAPFTIQGLEKKVITSFTITTSQGTLNIKVGGMVDRLDRVSDNQGGVLLRVVDYKTGSGQQPRLSDVEEVFDTTKILTKHSDYYLQTLLYSLIVRTSKEYNPDDLPVSPALLFIQHSGADNYDPTLFFGKERIADVRDYAEEYETRFMQVLTEIYEPSIPFIPTDNPRICATCPYRQLCNI